MSDHAVHDQPIRREDGAFVVEAELLAEAFGLSPERMRVFMREGAITSRCEAGTGADAGRWRLTFLHGERGCRFILDDTGTILKRATFPVRTWVDHDAPASGTSPGDNENHAKEGGGK
ncbi:MAG: DUF6522 family protein [Dichotomicrobium sp.]